MDNKEQVWEKVKEEMDELLEEVKQGDATKIEDEFGDLIFSLINYARFLGIDAENALERTNRKFIERFTKMEEFANNKGRNLHDMTLQEMDDIWNSIKRQNQTP
jgi:XTP/dITP diphosphohydrolase